LRARGVARVLLSHPVGRQNTVMRKILNNAVLRHLVYVLLIIVAGVLYSSITYDSVFFAPDEGAIAYLFERSAEGAIQHRDFYSVYGTGFYFVGKNLFNLFGSKLIVLRIAAMVSRLIIAVLIYVRIGFYHLVGGSICRYYFSFLS